jgi:hypothetical protein
MQSSNKRKETKMIKQGKLLLEWDGLGEQEDYDDMQEELTTVLERKNAPGYWYARVENFGWQSKDGHMYLEARKGGTFLYKILPKTECSYKIFNYGKGLMIQNWHHDSCTGNEKYYITPIAKSTFANESYKGGN